MPVARAERSPIPRVGVAAACLLAIIIAALDLVSGPEPELVGMLVAPPLLTAIVATYRWVLGVGGLSFVLAISLYLPTDPQLEEVQLVQLAGIVVSTAIAAVVSVLRVQASARMTSLRELAAVAQQAVLRPVADQLGDVRVGVRYISASAEADIGGDLYEALDTPYGTRVLIGDVRGKGLDAVRLASIVLGSYRHVAHERADLRAVMADLDRTVARSVGDEDFVTACLIEERGGMLTVVNSGHPAPLLLRNGTVVSLDPPAPAPPLGFLGATKPRIERLEPGDRILMFTDGLAEARRDQKFFPIEQRASRLLGHGSIASALMSLENALTEWVRHRLDDDVALILVEYRGSTSEGDDRPVWEWGATTSIR
ncbi:MAG: PP2C family protein-serine/threonine phosphatase [Mycobacteriales bacterium]